MRKNISNVAVLHVPKTAGTSLLKLIERSYPTQNIHRWYSDKKLPDEKCPEQFGHILIGHFHYGIQDSFFGNCDMVTVLRNPVERTISQLYFFRRSYLKREDEQNNPHKDWFKQNENPVAFVSRSKHWLLDNAMVRMISGVRNNVRFGELTDVHLEMAMENLSKFAYVGFQENFGNDVANLSRLYDWRRVAVPTNIRRENHYFDSAQKRALIGYNRLDLALYQFGMAVRADRLRENGIRDRWRGSQVSWLWRVAAPVAKLRRSYGFWPMKGQPD